MTEITPEMIEAGALAAMKLNGCGCMLNDERVSVLCDDPRLGEDREKECACREDFVAGLTAALAAAPAPQTVAGSFTMSAAVQSVFPLAEREDNEAIAAALTAALGSDPYCWLAITGTAGESEGCSKFFFIEMLAKEYVQKHGGYIKPLYAAPPAPAPQPVAFRPTYAQIKDAVQANVNRMHKAGESYLMFARWLSEDLDKLYHPAPQTDAEPDLVEKAARYFLDQCEGSDDPDERCPRHPEDCTCWKFHEILNSCKAATPSEIDRQYALASVHNDETGECDGVLVETPALRKLSERVTEFGRLKAENDDLRDRLNAANRQRSEAINRGNRLKEENDRLRAELADMTGKAERQWSGWVKEEVRAKAAEARIAELEAENKRMREALEPFALISSEGVVKQATGHVTITTCAEYFHAARAALAKEGE